MTCIFTLLILMAFANTSWADFGNYNSVLLGVRAAGMGGAFTAMTDDPAACSYYNPATLSQIQGSSFSANANLYNKYDTSFADAGNLSDSALKLNRGEFQGIPAAAGTAVGFGTFAAGISIMTPDYNTYAGDISLKQYPNSTTFVNSKDQSLWVGGNLAINFTDDFSAGVTFYYTSRDFQRETTEQTTSSANTKIQYESKTFTSNDVVYILGGYYKLAPNWHVGASLRLPSIQLSGDGSYYLSTLDTSQSNLPVIISKPNVQSATHIPEKGALGISYVVPGRWAFDFDTTIYAADSYLDLNDTVAGETISYKQIVNYAVGGEYYLRSWAAIRAGAFTNFSSHPEIINNGSRQGDHIDMLGFSSNLSIFTGKTSVSLGGYFSGGRGQSTQAINEQIVVTPKVVYIYSFLVASSYYF